MTVMKPDALGLPSHAADAAYSDSTLLTEDFLYDLLISEHADQAVAYIVSAYVAGAPLAELFDGPIQAAQKRVGRLWHDKEDGIFSEHRATGLIIQALSQLSMFLPQPPSRAPVAVGGAPSGDPYYIASSMCGLIFEANGFRATNLGPDTPFSAFESAIQQVKSDAVWISMSSSRSGKGRETVKRLREQHPDMLLFVGGKQADSLDRESVHPRTYVLGSMTDLDNTLKAVFSEPKGAVDETA